MAALTIMLRTYRQKKDGTFPIVIRIYDGRKTIFEYLGHSVRKDQFKDLYGKWVRKHPDAAFINNKIESKRIEILKKIDEAAGYIKVKGASLHSFSKYLEKRAKQFREADNIDMDRRIRLYKSEIEAMAGREVFSEEITAEWVRDLISHLKKPKYTKKGKHVPGNCHNTIMGKIKRLRTIYKQAINDKHAPAPNPFETYNIHYEPVNKLKLTIEEIHTIESLHLTGIQDIARDCFIFAFYCHGMRFGSLFKLEWKNVPKDVLEYQMNKGKKTREITLHPKAVAILKKYKKSGAKWVFPLCKRQWRDVEDFINMKGSATALVNAALKHVAAIAGINKPISTHIARHSFAYLLKTKKIDMHVIKDALGHTSMGTTESYLDDLDNDIINEEVGRAFD